MQHSKENYTDAGFPAFARELMRECEEMRREAMQSPERQRLVELGGRVNLAPAYSADRGWIGGLSYEYGGLLFYAENAASLSEICDMIEAAQKHDEAHAAELNNE